MTSVHKTFEGLGVAGFDHPQPFVEGLPQPLTGLRGELVEGLDLEVETRVLGRHLVRRPELFGERNAGDFAELGGTDR